MTKFDSEVAAARRRIAAMDDIDGFPDSELSTILAALECGLRRPKTGAHFDAFVMLQYVVRKQAFAGGEQRG